MSWRNENFKIGSICGMCIVFDSQRLSYFSGFPVRRGRATLKRDVSSTETACEMVIFPPFSFYPDKEVHVQITSNHWNSTRSNYVHEATVSWAENVNYQNFKVNEKK